MFGDKNKALPIDGLLASMRNITEISNTCAKYSMSY
jgi:hypothetical protein